MKELRVNGSRANFECKPAWAFDDLVHSIRRAYTTQSHLISSMKVDGVELTPTIEKSLSALPLKNIDSVEIITVHRNELVNETLEYLSAYLDQCIEYCDGAQKENDEDIMGPSFLRLVDGLETVFETVKTIKATLRSTLSDSTNERLLEIEVVLLDVVKALLRAKEANDSERMRELLKSVLPRHMKLWKSEGVPLLTRGVDQ